jgi:hypothetical protein
MTNIDQRAREMASDLFAAFERLTSDGKRPKVQEGYEVAVMEIIKAVLQTERDAALEEAAEICDYRVAHGDNFAEQIRALKSTPTEKDSHE